MDTGEEYPGVDLVSIRAAYSLVLEHVRTSCFRLHTSQVMTQDKRAEPIPR